jgi:glycosyltransferase involved in cell wall biosynthesis
VKVAQVTLRFDAPGGVETCVREVARGLVAAGDDVTVYTSDLYQENPWERRPLWSPRVDGARVRRFPVAKRLVPGLTMPLMTGLIRGLSDDRPDLIHAHSHRYGHVLEAAAVAHRLRAPFVVSTHYHPADSWETVGKKMLLRLQDHVFGFSAYRESAALIVESEVERARVAEFAPSGIIRTIPPGIDLSAWSHPESDLPPDSLPERYILYAGRIAQNKGLAVLLEALARLPPGARPDLVLMGQDWGLRSQLETLAKARGISGSIHWLGHVAGNEAYRAVFRRADLFVLPSEYEAFGLVLLEAMAADVPILATAVGATPEVLENGACGRLVPRGDAVALADAMVAELGDPQRATRRRDAARRRVRGLDWSVTVDRHRALYDELVRRA